MKCILNLNIKGISNIRFSCGEQEYNFCGEEKTEIAFDIPEPGIYDIKITQIPTEKYTVIDWLVCFLASIAELAFEIFTSSCNFKWQKEVVPYCFCTTVKIQMTGDRKIDVDICDSEFKGVWQYPKIKIKNISGENISTVYSLNERDFKNAKIHNIIKLSILILPLSAFFVLAVISYILSKSVLQLLIVSLVLALFIGFYVFQINKIKKSYSKEILAAKNKLNNIQNKVK
ncbi:MAG: hypothetical protein IJL87_03650 [Clostridia bacterium]|nr:hypothetical protein [Clostridia bacterium]